MAAQGIIVLLLLGAAVLLMATERLRPDLAALLLLFGLTAAGIVPRDEALRSLGRPAVMILVGVFVLTAGLQRSGVTLRIAHALLRLSGRSKSRLVVATMGAGASLSLFMSNVAATSLLMPAAVHAAHRVRLSSSRVLLPLAYATQLGGMATLLTTANIVSSGVLRDRGYEGFALHEFFVVGGLGALAGIAWMALIGVRLLPRESPAEEVARVARLRRTLSEQYRLQDELSVVQIDPKASCVGRALMESGLGQALGLSVLGIVRGSKTLPAPAQTDVLQSGDLLLVSGVGARTEPLEAAGLRVQPRTAWAGDLATEEIGLHEVIVAPRSRVVGQTIRDIHFRSKYGLSVVALWREGRSHWAGVSSIPLRFGDALLLSGPAAHVPRIRSDPDWVVLRYDPTPPAATRRMAISAAILAVSLGAAMAGLVPVAEAMLAGALLMVLTGCMSMDEAYQAIEWRTIVLVAGMLPVGVALRQSGAAAAIGDWIAGAAQAGGPAALLSALFFFAALLTQVVPGSGAAVPAIVGPIAIETAVRAGADPRAFMLGVALATSTSFMTPFGHPVNAFVMAPGGYRVRDYLVAGAPLAAVTSLVILWALRSFAPVVAR